MNNFKYRVIIKVSYSETWFEFDNPAEAVSFATTCLQSMVTSEDTKKKSKIVIETFNPDAKEEED